MMQHLIISLTHLGVCPLALVRFIRPCVIFDLRNENRFLLLIQNHHKDNKVYGVALGSFIGSGLQGKEEVEAAFNDSIVEKPVVRPVIARFEMRVSGTTDIEDGD